MQKERSNWAGTRSNPWFQHKNLEKMNDTFQGMKTNGLSHFIYCEEDSKELGKQVTGRGGRRPSTPGRAGSSEGLRRLRKGGQAVFWRALSIQEGAGFQKRCGTHQSRRVRNQFLFLNQDISQGEYRNTDLPLPSPTNLQPMLARLAPLSSS